MNFQWILLSFFLVALIWGMVKAIKRPMLKNIVRLASVPVAFLITYILQIAGVFQSLVGEVIALLDLASMIPGFEDAIGFIIALGSTLISPILFVVFFLVFLAVLRLIIFIAFKIADSVAKKNAEKAALAEKVVEAVATVEETVEAEVVADGGEVEAQVVAEEAAPAEETVATPVVETTPETTVEEPVVEKPKKKSWLPDECAWKRVVSVTTGAISGLLVLAVMLMPLFYYMSIVSTATDGIDGLDADDSNIYQVVTVVDDYILTPYKDSFVAGFYDTLGLKQLMNSVTRESGKMVLASGEVRYADDVLKNLVEHGVSAAAQVTSGKSTHVTLGEDIECLISDPLVSSIVADALLMVFEDIEITEADENDILGGFTNTFLVHYKEADKAIIEKDLKAVGKTVSALAKTGIISQLIGGNAEFDQILEDKDNLSDVVESISGLSAFGPTIEGAFGLGIDVLGSTLGIPATSEEAYSTLIEHLLDATNNENSAVSFDYSEVDSFVRYCIANGKQYTKNNKHSGYDDFEAYKNRWTAVQYVFAHSGEDRSFGDFTIEIDGKLYILKSKRFVEVPSAPGADASQSDKDKYNRDYAKRISSIADLIHYVTRNADASVNESSLKNVISNYLNGSSVSAAGKDTAEMIVNADYSKLDAVTIDKMLAATDFSDWTEEEKASDSKKCVDIIFNLLGMMDMLGSSEGAQDMNALAGQLGVVGETMDIMRETTCIKDLAPLMLEGLMSNDMFAMIPMYTAYNYNDAVLSGAIHSQTGEPTTYTDIMNELLTMLENLGGMIK